MKGGRRPPEPTPPSWIDLLPVANPKSLADGYYLIATSVLVRTNIYLDNLIVYIDASTSPAGVALIYIGENERYGLYYDAALDDFAYNINFGTYSSQTIATHINDALGTSFVGVTAQRLAEMSVTKDDILGKLIPVEP